MMPPADAISTRSPEKFRSQDLIEVRHILLPAAPAGLDSRLAQRKLTESLIRQLRANPGRFAEFAGNHSFCLPLGPGERSVETRYDFHVVEVLAREEGLPLPCDYVKEWITQFLTERT